MGSASAAVVLGIGNLASNYTVPGEYRVVYVHDYGAVGDSVTDDSAAFQKAVNALGYSGGTVITTLGTYYFNTGIG